MCPKMLFFQNLVLVLGMAILERFGENVVKELRGLRLKGDFFKKGFSTQGTSTGITTEKGPNSRKSNKSTIVSIKITKYKNMQKVLKLEGTPTSLNK